MFSILLLLGGLALGIGIAEYYHYRIDRARRETVPLDQPDMWDLSHPAPQPIVSAQDFARMKRTGRITKMVGGGRG